MAHDRSRGGAVAPVELRAGTLARDLGAPGAKCRPSGSVRVTARCRSSRAAPVSTGLLIRRQAAYLKVSSIRRASGIARARAKAHHDPASARSADAAREGRFHLRLHAHRAPPGTPRPAGQVVNQHGLAYARLAAHHQGPGAGRAAHLGTGPGFPGHRPAILRARRVHPKRDPGPTSRQIKSAGGWPGTWAPGMPARGR